MHVLVTPLRANGRPIDQRQVRATPGIRGDLRIEQYKPEELGRISRVAFLATGLPLDDSPLPRLLDADLHSMATGGFVLSGIELVDGVAYAQSWWCRPDQP